MTIDELKKSWTRLDASSTLSEASAEGIERRVALHLVASTRDKLSRQFHRMGVICVLIPLLFIPLWQMSHALTISASIYAIIAGVLQFILAGKTDKINLSQSTVARALADTIELESLRSSFRILGMILGLPVIAFMLWVVYEQNDQGMFIGCLAGVVVGAAIGLEINARMVRQVRRMKEELSDID